MIIINDNDYSNPYDKRMNNKNNESTTSVCGNRNSNDRNYKIISNDHNDKNIKTVIIKIIINNSNL